ncbi:glycosyltransferase family 2 protein [Desulfurococcus mucosus]|uniref:Glycosyl transferase family 2 n=1 Tax=Desulfurococcus mucosus (strain ATCC 35584 / DSM 2162 / JCM 9187 / O7/1) TaxID=765177 RepID=E8R8B7_DESM0|nr:glycosyltransferase [Desulfurococcus mucosus]ADV64743.1 glycosyl transferase family 2 [Desulfurococcus mucosus DSM 2162]
MKSILVSIVIPVKNERGNVEQLIMSIYGQTYRPIEVVVVDGGSTDGTLEALQELKAKLKGAGFAIKVLKEEDFGSLRSPANARNIGVLNSSGEVIVFFDADFDLSGDPEAIEKIVAGLGEGEHVAITYAPNGHTWVERHLALDDIVYYFRGGRPLHVVCCFRRSVFSRALFDASLGFGEDLEFLARAKTMWRVVGTGVRRCYPHTLGQLMKQQLWYGRTALRYFRKVGAMRWPIDVARSNAVLGIVALDVIVSAASMNVLLTLAVTALLLAFVAHRWLRRDVVVLGGKPRLILERLAWTLLRETYGRLWFDIGLLLGLARSSHRDLGR